MWGGGVVANREPGSYIGGFKYFPACDIEGAKEPEMMYFPILNEELKNPRILKITG